MSKKKREEEDDMKRTARLLTFLGVILASPQYANAKMIVDPFVIAQLESSNNPQAFNKSSGATGLFQITPCVVDEFNRRYKTKLTMKDMYQVGYNTRVAMWYLTERIPTMLEYFKLPVTTQYVLWAWNAGIAQALKGVMPEETRVFINRYNKTAREKKNEWK